MAVCYISNTLKGVIQTTGVVKVSTGFCLIQDAVE